MYGVARVTGQTNISWLIDKLHLGPNTQKKEKKKQKYLQNGIRIGTKILVKKNGNGTEMAGDFRKRIWNSNRNKSRNGKKHWPLNVMDAILILSITADSIQLIS